MADDRKVFPLESVLALVTGKKDADVKELAGFIAGRSVTCAACAAVIKSSWVENFSKKRSNSSAA